MKVLVVGSGGREHALAWKLSQSGMLDELHAAPGNPGIAELGDCHPVGSADVAGIVRLAQHLSADLVVVGPEAPLVAGLADALTAAGIDVFGPTASAARIEGSKTWAKEIMRAAGVPSAATLPAPQAPCVVKADGLAAGKGVFVCRTQGELAAALRAASRLGGPLVVEELLEGEELSLFALSDGRDALALAPARDFKRVGEGDTGANTGGMGSYSPVPEVGPDDVEELLDLVHRPVLRELAARGAPFCGLLYAGLMLTEDGPRVLEFNCRFGDPETQSILPRLDGDLLAALLACSRGDVGAVRLAPSNRAAVTVVLAAPGYPSRGDAGTPIDGVVRAQALGALVFHAGTAVRAGALVTDGGRILDVTGVGATLAEARAAAYEAAESIHFPGVRFRGDIAAGVASVLA
ncbi:MAG: phosphoribosylamine--glycine ligase [Actinomycetota bacterium]|nr:phosphoribosylamine--glycine ligase [Actinomycetota bacterium]